MTFRVSIPDIEAFDRDMANIWRGLPDASGRPTERVLPVEPGSVCRIARQFLRGWEVYVTSSNEGWIADTAAKRYRAEWSSGDSETNQAIENAIHAIDLAYGNNHLNYRLAEIGAEVLRGILESSAGDVLVCDVGAGKGSTTFALLDRLLLLLEIGEIAEPLLQKCNFYLIEPSVKRVVEAKEML